MIGTASRALVGLLVAAGVILGSLAAATPAEAAGAAAHHKPISRFVVGA